MSDKQKLLIDSLAPTNTWICIPATCTSFPRTKWTPAYSKNTNHVHFWAIFDRTSFFASETIFGYKDLRVKLYYTAGSLETYLGMVYSEKLDKHAYEGVKPDEVLPKVLEKLAPQVHDNLDSFVACLHKEDNFKPYGELLHSFTIDGKKFLISVFYDIEVCMDGKNWKIYIFYSSFR